MHSMLSSVSLWTSILWKRGGLCQQYPTTKLKLSYNHSIQVLLQLLFHIAWLCGLPSALVRRKIFIGKEKSFRFRRIGLSCLPGQATSNWVAMRGFLGPSDCMADRSASGLADCSKIHIDAGGIVNHICTPIIISENVKIHVTHIYVYMYSDVQKLIKDTPAL